MVGTADLRVFAQAAGNPDLLRLGVAYVAFGGAEFGVWIALLLYGYDVGGATGASAIALVQLVPSAILAPWLGGSPTRTGRGVCCSPRTRR